MNELIIVLLILRCLFYILRYLYVRYKIDCLLKDCHIYSIQQIIQLKKNKEYHRLKGIYILLNKDKHKYYVGQSVDLFNRIYTHFKGRGNKDVYFDYKRGDEFVVRYILLQDSGYNSLNKLERHGILRFHSFYMGYNKTRGNK